MNPAGVHSPLRLAGVHATYCSSRPAGVTRNAPDEPPSACTHPYTLSPSRKRPKLLPTSAPQGLAEGDGGVGETETHRAECLAACREALRCAASGLLGLDPRHIDSIHIH
eukprot:5392822-Pyramimonas_sp.AAC.2